MNKNSRLFWAGTYAATLYWFLSEMFTPMLSLYVSGLNFSIIQISIIFAAQTFVPFLFTIQIGYIADRIGQQNMLVLGAAFMILGSLLLLFYDSFFIFIIVQTLVGIGHIAVWLSSQTIVTFVGGGSREKAIARMSFFTAFGQLAGPLFGSLIYGAFNFTFVFISYMALSFALLAVFLIMPKNAKEPSDTAPSSAGDTSNANSSAANTTTANVSITQEEKPRFSFIGSYKVGGQLYLSNSGIQAATMISFSLAFILFIRVTYLPIYLKELSYTPDQISLLIALWSLASIIIRPFAARLIEAYGRTRTTGAALLISLVGLLGFTILPNQMGIILSIIFVGIGTGLNQPLAISLLSRSTSKQNRGLGMGLRLMSNRMANWVCPLALGATSQIVGLTLSFAVVTLPLALVSLYSMKLLGKLKDPQVNYTKE